MAANRLEKIGTIFTRTQGLIKLNAMKWEDRPLWYDIYDAFPPKEVPSFDRPAPNIPLRKIFYEEDKIRAKFHENVKNVGTYNLGDLKYESLTQRFVKLYKKLEENYDGSASKNQIFEEALEMLKLERNDSKSLSKAFKAAENETKIDSPKLNVQIKDILKE